MSSARYSPEQYSRLELIRRISGEKLDKFLTKAAIVGRRIVGETANGDLINVPPSEEQRYEREGLDDDDDFQILQPYSQSKVDIFGKGTLALPLLDRRMPAEMNYNFARAASQLTARNASRYNPVNKEGNGNKPVKTSGLYAELDRIGLNYGFENQNEVPISISGIQVLPDIDYPDNILLGLSLDPSARSTHMLVEQSIACVEHLMAIKGGKRVAYPIAPAPLAIPFATIPRDIEASVSEKFFIELDQEFVFQAVMAGVKSINES